MLFRSTPAGGLNYKNPQKNPTMEFYVDKKSKSVDVSDFISNLKAKLGINDTTSFTFAAYYSNNIISKIMITVDTPNSLYGNSQYYKSTSKIYYSP